MHLEPEPVMYLLILFVFVLVAYILVHYYRLINYWKKRGVKYVTPLPFVGNLLPTILETESIPEYIARLYNLYPKERYCGIYHFGVPVLMIRDPELIKTITIKEFNHFMNHGVDYNKELNPVWEKNLFTIEGAKWRNLRQTLTPIFTSRKMKTMYVLMEDCNERLINYLNNKNETIIELELIELIKRFLMDVMATTVFGLETNSVTDKDDKFFKMGTHLTDFSGLKRYKFFLYKFMNSYLAKLFNITMVSAHVTDFFLAAMKNTMEIRTKENIIRPDLVHLLMEARKGRLYIDEINGTTNDGSSISSQKQFAMEFTDEDIAAQAIIFTFGGYDTTAKLLAFCSYELATNPVIQEKLREEIDANFRKFNGKIGYEDLFAMKYLDMVISETLRKWPPGIFIDRRAGSPFSIKPEREEEEPLHLHEGEVIFFPVFALHRDANYWPSPDIFDPERFNEENKAKIIPGTYMPFGLGPRNCIGTRYGIMVAKLFIFYLLANFEIVPTEKSKIPLEICKNNILLLPEHGFWFGLKKRQNLKKTN